jgi:hypothetical protein
MGNDLVGPDGSVAEMVVRYARQVVVARLLDAKKILPEHIIDLLVPIDETPDGEA